MTSVDDWVEWCGSKGFKDSGDYLKGIYEWRKAWRPKRVRVLLVAESHVGEQKGDLKVHVRPPEGTSKSLPPSYVRLVYCLGYGEDCLCKPKPKPNPGTWQFWKIFQAIKDCNADAKQPRKGEVMQKMNLLREMQTKGVWLVDASIAALYYPRNNPIRVPNELIHESFRKFVWPKNNEILWIVEVETGNAGKAVAGAVVLADICMQIEKERSVQREKPKLLFIFYAPTVNMKLATKRLDAMKSRITHLQSVEALTEREALQEISQIPSLS